jgi:DtxR family Mn-dependent transcriptional regulator
MDNHNFISESEQMYLVTIARLGEMADECPIPISKVADVLEITNISANQMVHHLEELGLVNYTPYKGVDFTELGWQTAERLLRSRRLWEVFLVEHLQYAPEDAEPIACNLEHTISQETANRLAEYLDWPQVSPQGKPIPYCDKKQRMQPGILLSNLTAGTTGQVSAVQARESENAFLQQTGITVGCQLVVMGSQQDGVYLIQSGNNEPVSISKDLTQKIYVKPNISD